MNLSQLFRSYELLVDDADDAFQKMLDQYPDCIQCEQQCSDCCHAVFGLFPVEAVYLNQQFIQLEESVRMAALGRGKALDKDLARLEDKLRAHQDDPQMRAYVLARERMRCPLLDGDDGCILYAHRPITCRVYGIPTVVHGKARVCGKAAFEKGETYPLFDLDTAYRNLYDLSREIMDQDPDKASLLISVSAAIQTPMEDLLRGVFG